MKGKVMFLTKGMVTKANEVIDDRSRFFNSLQGISLLSIVVAMVASGASFSFIELFKLVESVLYFDAQGHNELASSWVFGDWKLLLILPFGGLLVGMVTYYFMPERKNVGLVGVIEATHKNEGKISLREGLGVGLVSAISIGSGASVGRYGPAVHIGASLGSSLSSILHLTRKSRLTLLGAGVAAAIAASFNAPFAAVIFTHEVIVKNYSIKSFAPITFAATVGGILGNYYNPAHMFELVVLEKLISFDQFMVAALIGLTGAFMAIVFMRILLLGNKIGGFVTVDPRLKPVLGGLILAGIALLFPQTLGLSSYMVGSAITSDINLAAIGVQESLITIIIFLVVLLALKMFAVALSFGFGFNGGLVGPAMFVGSLFGCIMANIIATVYPDYLSLIPVYSLVGLAVIISVILGSPIATTILVLELSGSYNITSSVLIAVAIANIVATKVFSKSYFDVLLSKKGVDMSQGVETILMKSINISTVMNQRYFAVSENAGREQIIATLEQANNSQEVYVLDNYGKLLGAIDVNQLMKRSSGDALVAKDILTKISCYLTEQEDVYDGLEKSRDFVGLALPVVASDTDFSLVGTVSEGELIDQYRKAVKEARKEEQGID